MSRRRRGSGGVIVLLAVAAVLCAAIAGGVLFRHEILHEIVESRLSAMGLKEVRFDVERFTLDRIAVADFRTAGPLSAARIEIRYTPGGLLRGRLRAIDVDGLRADLTRPDGPIRAIVSRGGADGGDGGMAVPLVTVTDARLVLPAGKTPVTATLGGRIGPETDGTVPLTLEAVLDSPRGRADVRLTGAVTRGGDAAAPLATAGELRIEEGRLALGDISLGGLTATLPVRVEASREGTAVRLAAPGALRIGTLEAAVWHAQPFTVALSPGEAPLLRLGGDGAETPRTRWAVRLDPSRIVIERTGKAQASPPITVEADGASAEGALGPGGGIGARARIAALDLAASGTSAAASDIDLALSPAREVRLKVRALSLRTPKGALAPVAVDATMRPDGNGFGFSGAISPAGTGATVAVTGQHDPQGAGRAEIDLRGFDFDPGGLQPATLSPALADISAVSGAVRGSAVLRWSGGALDGKGRIELDGLSATVPGGRIEGLAGDIAFESLAPPRTAPRQSLTASRIEAGAVLTDASVVFSLLPDGVVRIDRADAHLAGGRIAMTDEEIDPFARAIAVEVDVEALDLSQLVALMKLDDVAATGQLSGALPIRIKDGAIAIENARFATEGGGTLRIRSKEAARLLAHGGREVELMLRALEDFRYERLSIEIDKSAGGSTLATLHTLGRNPEVLDGRPFQINVNLETDLDEVFQAIAEWYRLSGRALRDIVGGGPRGGSR